VIHIKDLIHIITKFSSFASDDMGSWEGQARQLLLDEEEDDEEFFFLLLPAILSFLSEEQSETGAAIESFVEFKRSTAAKTLEALEEKKKHDEDFSIKKCLEELDTIDGLTDEDRSYAMEVFESGFNREVFMSSKNHNVRLFWLKREIKALAAIM